MIDLRNTYILVKTEEENEMLLKEAEKHFIGIRKAIVNHYQDNIFQIF